MVDMKTVLTPEEMRDARVKRVRDMSKVETVQVEPADGEGFTADGMRELLSHPTAGGFRAEGPATWPNDTFTFRRLKEGSIKLVDQKKQHTGHSERGEK